MLDDFTTLENDVETFANHLFCDDHDLFLTRFEQRVKQLTQTLNQTPYPQILLVEKDPVQFLASFLAVCTLNCQLFLGNPDWGQEEWEQVFSQVHPHVILGNIRAKVPSPPSLKHPLKLRELLIMIPTGGTSGKIRFVMHDWQTLTASIRGFRQYFQVNMIHSFCVLPLYHVSGLMQVLRSFTTHGNFSIFPFKDVEKNTELSSHQNYTEFFISLVPTQLQRLLNEPKKIEWLSQFHTILLGGSPPSLSLLERARNHHLRLAPTYGMTETASQIATLKPDDFLQGYENSGQILPHAQIMICNENGETLRPNNIGIITIKSQSLALGYYPKFWENNQAFESDDLGMINQQGYLTIMGRNSDKIITGGENVFPVEVESTILATGLVKDVCVMGLPDEIWGEQITVFYVPFDSTITSKHLPRIIQEKLSKFKQPKTWIQLDELPRNLQGKINREKLSLYLSQDPT